MAVKTPIGNLTTVFNNPSNVQKTAYYNLSPIKIVYSLMNAISGSATTYTAFQLLTGINRTISGATTDTTPTAAQLVTALRGLLCSDMYNTCNNTDTVLDAALTDGSMAIDTMIANTGNTLTLSAGTGVTLVGDTTIATNQVATLRIQFTSATTVTIFINNPA